MMKRTFLGWEEPVIGHTARWLLENFEDLSEVQVVVRGSRAGRRLLEKLAVEADRQKRPLFLPKIGTIAQTADDLFEAPEGILPPASDLTQRLAWMEALRRLPEKEKAKFYLIPEGVEAKGQPELLLAKRVQSLWSELGGAGLGFAKVARVLEEKMAEAPASEAERWMVLERVYSVYGTLLNELGWMDPAERRALLVKKGKVKEKIVVLAGVVEILPVFVQMLQALTKAPQILIFAPESEKEGFDEWGRLETAYWAKRQVGLNRGQIHPVVRAGDQAARLAEMATQWPGATFSISEESSVAGIRETLRESGMETHWAEGKKMGEGRVAGFLRAVADYVSRDSKEPASWQAAAWLARHPDGLGGKVVVAKKLDDYAADHIPQTFDPTEGAEIGEIGIQLDQAVGLFPEEASASDQAEKVSQMLTKVYGEMEVNLDVPSGRMMRDSLQTVRKVMAELGGLELPYLKKIPMGEYLRLVLAEMEGEQVPEPAREGAVELVGWLELAEEDSPSVAVASFHEGAVPKSITSDEFLPGHLREILGVNDNENRYARDAYALAVIVGTREKGRGVVGLIVPSFNSAGDPVKPSRLLLAGLSGKELAARVLALMEKSEKKRNGPAGGGGQGFGALSPGTELISRVSVTAFRDYLMSPRYFYFRRVLRLKEVEDEPGELSAMGFGILIHSVAGAFAREGSIRESHQEEEIFHFLKEELARQVKKQFGRRPKAAVGWQIEMAEERLQAFARVQARERAAGWKIVVSEEEGTEEKRAEVGLLDSQGRTLIIHGRPDRMDQNEKSGRWRIVDIKTSSSAQAPDRAHCGADGRWKDLQMPLYRELAPKVLGNKGKDWNPGLCDLVYFQLPKDGEKAGISQAMSEGVITGAMEKAKEVAGCILDGKWDGLGELDGESVHPTFLALCGQAGIPQEAEEEGEE